MLRLSLDMSKFIGVELHQREFNGELVDCVSIPVKWNGARFKKGGSIIVEFTIVPKKPNKKNETHYVSLFYLPRYFKEQYMKVKELGLYEQVKYIGHISNWGKKYFIYPNSKIETDLDKALDTEE